MVCLFLTDKNVCRVLVCSWISYFKNKWIKEIVLSFCKKIQLHVQEYLQCWLGRLASLQRAEYKFNCGITVLKKTDLVARAHQLPIKKFTVGISFSSCLIIFIDVLGRKVRQRKLLNTGQHHSETWKSKPNHPKRARTKKSNLSSSKCEGLASCFLRLQSRDVLWILARRPCSQ